MIYASLALVPEPSLAGRRGLPAAARRMWTTAIMKSSLGETETQDIDFGGRMHESTLSSPASELQASMRRNFRELHIELDNVQRKEIGGLPIVIAQASITRVAGFDNDGATSSSRHTVVYHEAPGAEFPRFGLRAMELLFKVAGVLGLQGLSFADQPEFSKQYFVLATQPLGARAILDRKVRDWLLAHPGMNIEAGSTGVLVYGSGSVLHGSEVEMFAREAAQLVGLLEQARRMAAGSPKQPNELDEARAFAKQLPASAGRSMEKDFHKRRVTQADIDAFLRQNPPRKIPKNIACYYEFAFGLAGMGFFFLVGAAVIGVGGTVQRQWGAFVLVTIFFLIAATMIYLGLRRFRREKRLLRYGELAVAKILGLEPAGIEENGQEIYKVRARYEAGGQSRRVECRASGKPAKRIAAEGRPTRILYDPAHPEHILLVDALVNTRGE